MRSPSSNKLAEREVKNTAGGFGGAGSQWDADRFIYAKTPDVFVLLEFHPLSKSGPEPPLCILLLGAQSRTGAGRLGSPK